MRNFIVLLCLFSVIACPYECAVKQIAVKLTVTEAKQVCSKGCCSHRQDRQNDQEAPAAPTPEKDGLCCVCEGVILDSASRIALDELAGNFDVAWVDSKFLTDHHAPVAAIQIGFVEPLILRDSKSTRIALRSLLL